MHDEDILALAARAAGVDFDGYDAEQNCLYKNHTTSYGPGKSYWDPLGWEKDSLNLAVKLRIEISFSCEASRYVACSYWIPWEGPGQVTEVMGDSPLESTQRAIVLAAAEIGKHLLKETAHG